MSAVYRPDIDGLRAIAVLSVLLFHIDISIFSGGFVGVDIFFVISGYLISSIIVREIENNSFSLVKFYVRRFRRILPALIVVLFFTIILGYLLLEPERFLDYAKSLVATAIFSSNIIFFLDSGYFDTASGLKPLLHTWSLAVEEQYYIIFPVFMMMLSKWINNRYTVFLLIMAAISFWVSVIGLEYSQSGTFYMAPTRAWEFLVGSILAVYILDHNLYCRKYIDEILGISGLSMLFFSIFIYTKETGFPGASALLPTIGTALIILSGLNTKTYTSRILSYRPLVFVGLISYSLYLWHWPILVYTKLYVITELTEIQIFWMLVVIFIISTISWHYIEQPFRKRRSHENSFKILCWYSLSSIIVLCIGLLIIVFAGFPDRYKGTDTKMIENDTEWLRWGMCQEKLKNIDGVFQLCDIGNLDVDKHSFIFWGDSHARALASAINLNAEKNKIKGKLATRPACPPLLSIDRKGRDTCEKFNNKILKYIIKSSEIDTVILSARWVLSANGTRYKSESGKNVQLIDRLDENRVDKGNAALFEHGLARTINELRKYGKNVILVKDVPEVGYDVPSAGFIANITGRDLNNVIAPSYSEFKERTMVVDSIFKHLKQSCQLTIVDPSSYLCDSNICKVTMQGTNIYRDDDHLSTFGSKYISMSFDSVLSAL